MRSAQPRRPAVALSRFDLPDAHGLLIHSCEDCACAVSDLQSAEPAGPHRQPAALAAGCWTQVSGIAEFPLDAEHTLAFNPLGTAGPVVLNEPGRDVLGAFRQPASLGEVARARGQAPEDLAGIVRRLAELQLIHPENDPPPPPVFPEPDVLTAWLHVTNGCNLRCHYCYLTKTAEPMEESTGRAAVEAIIGSAVRNGFTAVKLKYAGGEASLNHVLVIRLHAYARELAAAAGLRLLAVLLTNGVRLPASLVQACKDEGIKVMVSLDGVGRQHDIQRPFANGRPSFGLVERTIGELTSQGLAPHLSITITGQSASGLADVVRFALDRELTFSLNLYRDNECAASFTDLQYEEKAMTDAILAAFGVIAERLPRWSVLGAVLDRGQLVQPRQRSCGVGQDYVVIDQRGDVAKCHMEIERTLGSVMSADPLQLVREDRSSALNLLVDDKEGCRDCTWRYWCSGGCTVATFRATGRYDVRSPNCGIYKAIYPEALRLEGLRLLRYAVG